MHKVLEVTEPIHEWLDNNGDLIHAEILHACETALAEDTNFVYVMDLQVEEGIVKVTLSGIDNIIKSLQLTQNNYIKKEDFESAARTRDCVVSWTKKKNI